jgi:signal transduction histidine kinase
VAGVSDHSHPGPDWRWALPAARILTLVLLAAITVTVAAPDHRVAVGVALVVSVCGSAYGLSFGPERWPQRLVGLALFAGGGLALLAVDARAPGWLASGVAIIAGIMRLPQRPGLVFATVVAMGTVLAPLARGDTGAVATMAAMCGIAAVIALAIGGARNRAVAAERLLAAEQAARESAAEAHRLAERQRLAREIHDILAHTLSSQSVQLEGARQLLAHGADPAAVQERIETAQRLAREGLAETRRAVQSLRGDGRPLAETLRALADTAGARYLEEGAPWALTAPVALAIERTVQEGLTNARKHAPGAAVTVALRYGDDLLRVEVVDTGPPAAPTNGQGNNSGGYGLGGMRERAALIGAELRTGPDGKGYRICLTVPRAALSA